jgi:hypothetical protein
MSHIILIGFKHVGKSVIGAALAKKLDKIFIDLDNEIEKHYAAQNAQALSCKQIMAMHGEDFFRSEEETVLSNTLNTSATVLRTLGTPASGGNTGRGSYPNEFQSGFSPTSMDPRSKNDGYIIALGGGTPLTENNQKQIQPHRVILITAPPEHVWPRIIAQGLPAYFTNDEDPATQFHRLWTARENIYKKLTQHIVHNDTSINQAVEQLAHHL